MAAAQQQRAADPTVITAAQQRQQQQPARGPWNANRAAAARATIAAEQHGDLHQHGIAHANLPANPSAISDAKRMSEFPYFDDPRRGILRLGRVPDEVIFNDPGRSTPSTRAVP